METNTPLSDKEIVSSMKLFRGFLAGYAISEDGKIYSLMNENFVKVFDGPYNTKQINLRGKTYYVHRLIAEAYIPKPSNKHTLVMFKDEDKSNIHKDNLYWELPNNVNGRKDKAVKINSTTVLAIKKYFISLSGDVSSRIKNTSVQFGVSTSTIYNLINNKGHYQDYIKLSPYHFTIDDTVMISNSSLKTHGKFGTISGINLLERKIVVVFDDKSAVRTKPENIIKAKRKIVS